MIICCQSCQSTFKIDANLIKPTGSNVKCSKCQLVFKIFPPEAINRRKHSRIQTRNLISHISFDENGKPVSQGLSKAIDISMGGILLETPHPIESGSLTLAAIGLDNRFVEIKGELVHCKKLSAGMYRSGIKFVDSDEQVRNFVVKLIKEYTFRKSRLSYSLDP